MLVEYIWLDKNNNPRSKTRIIYEKMTDSVELPIWNYDGSSTNQASGSDSEVLIRPVLVSRDPFRIGSIPAFLVLCDTWLPDLSIKHPTKKYK